MIPGTRAAVETVSTYWAARDADLATQLAALEADIKVTLAGPQANLQHRPSKRERGWDDDIARAQSYAGRAVLLRAGRSLSETTIMVDLTPEEVQEVAQLLKRLAAETEALVAANWPAILRVAEALLERPLLSEADLDRLIAGGASASPPFVLKQGGAE